VLLLAPSSRVRASPAATAPVARRPPSFVGFCTVESSANGSADFRVTKNLDVHYDPRFCDHGIGSHDITRGGLPLRERLAECSGRRRRSESCAKNLGVNSINKSVHSAGAVFSGS
jgi:hypothetical protein